MNYIVQLISNEYDFDIICFRSKYPEFSNRWLDDLDDYIKKHHPELLSYHCYNYISIIQGHKVNYDLYKVN